MAYAEFITAVFSVRLAVAAFFDNYIGRVNAVCFAKHLPAEHVTLWVAAIDEELTSHSYIVPGLGDAGDLAYGVKK